MILIEPHRITDWKKFVKAGDALFTIKNAATGNRFTFRVHKHDEKDLWFVSVLTRPQNDDPHSYTYLGTIFGTQFRETLKSRISKDAQSFRVFTWLSAFLHSDVNLPAGVEIYHEGRCGRCGRTLTVPESIESGFGPECIKMMFDSRSATNDIA